MFFLGSISLLLFIVFISVAIYYYYKRKKFTRERFAFAVFFASSATVTLIIQTFFGYNPYVTIIGIINVIFNANIQPQQAGLSDNILAILTLFIFLYYMNSFYKNWNGLISEKQYENEIINGNQPIPFAFAFEGLSELHRMKAKLPPSPAYEKKQSEKYTAELLQNVDNCSWNNQASSLIKLKYPSLSVTEDDWHDRISCWIGEDKKIGFPVVIFCPQNTPSKENILSLVSDIKKDYLKDEARNIELLIITPTGPKPAIEKAEGVTIQSFVEEDLLKNLVDFSDYIADIKKQVEKNKLPDSDLTLRDIYVESQVKDSDQKDIEITLEKHLEQWINSPSRQQIALLGEYGQGKSTGSLMFTYNLLCTKNIRSNRIPVFIDLRGKNPSSLEPEQLLAVWAAKYNINPKAMFTLLVAGRLSIIFEGFDEMQGVADQESRIAHFASLWKFSQQNSKIMITGRPNFFLDDEEMKQALGINKSQGIGPSCKAIYLQPFNNEQILSSLRHSDKSTQQEIISLCKTNNSFKDLASRPSLLYIISILWNSGKMKKYRNTSELNSALVMSNFIDHCCNRQTEKQDKKKASSLKFMNLSENEIKYFMDGIAVHMMHSSRQNQIRGNDFKKIVQQLYSLIPDKASSPKVMLENPQKTLKERLQDNPEATDIVYTNVRSYGLLVRDLSTNDSFKFPHKSFLEYLYAEYIANQIINYNFIKRNAINMAISDTKSSTGKYYNVERVNPEALNFAGEIVANHFTETPRNNQNIKNRKGIIIFFNDLIFTPKRLPFFPIPKKMVSQCMQNYLAITVASNASYGIMERASRDLFVGYFSPILKKYNLQTRAAVAYKTLIYLTKNKKEVDSAIGSKYGDKFIVGLSEMLDIECNFTSPNNLEKTHTDSST
ncbi:hypothetical protein SAMN05660337_3216 [Maridesulfovibrio ferrireducens]|uniref:NACHT domain-containing protein n=1 Tax=Maridesulfovibrio ferrireducens TaxID=246191 RepID=A0A1G9KUK8_9BACT|nr:hypothetical protein [Maridesulfovibrio ferrireducens]SDL53244.1 hypothetical protein SAMN05660337_3216 [Maridesulfovibrio ferrireducens]